jgi:hypothetical protein
LAADLVAKSVMDKLSLETKKKGGFGKCGKRFLQSDPESAVKLLKRSKTFLFAPLGCCRCSASFSSY